MRVGLHGRHSESLENLRSSLGLTGSLAPTSPAQTRHPKLATTPKSLHLSLYLYPSADRSAEATRKLERRPKPIPQDIGAPPSPSRVIYSFNIK